MYSALYYPHTQVRRQELLKTALLMWDELHLIVPSENFVFQCASPEERDAFEVIVKRRVPTLAEQTAAHEVIEDFVAGPLPPAFSYADATRAPYELYPQKLMEKTWDLLLEAELVGPPLRNLDYPSVKETGLSIMSILADCCAGTKLARVTDQGDAYAFLSDSIVRARPARKEAARQELMSIPLQIASAEEVPLKSLVAMRQREKAGQAPGLMALRHRLIDSIEGQVKELAKAKTESDRNQITREFEQLLREDLRGLREALKLETNATLSSKVVVASVLGIAGAAFAALAPVGIPIAGLVGAGTLLKGGAAFMGVGGLLNTRFKFAKARTKILEDHPAAYLYEALQGSVRY